MIRGRVNSMREAAVPPVLRDGGGKNYPISSIVDTGFNGFLTLPPDLIARLGLQLVARVRALLADGSETLLESYEAAVLWDGQLRAVAADCMPGVPLVGMALLEGFFRWH